MLTGCRACRLVRRHVLSVGKSAEHVDMSAGRSSDSAGPARDPAASTCRLDVAGDMYLVVAAVFSRLVRLLTRKAGVWSRDAWQRVLKAYEILSDPSSKRLYDDYGLIWDIQLGLALTSPLPLRALSSSRPVRVDCDRL